MNKKNTIEFLRSVDDTAIVDVLKNGEQDRLIDCFVWSLSPQGHEHWLSINESQLFKPEDVIFLINLLEDDRAEELPVWLLVYEKLHQDTH